MTRARLQLEGATQFLVAAFIVWIGLAVSNTYPLNLPIGRDVRWLALGQLAACALLYAATGRRLRVPPLFVAAAVFVVLVFLSITWSPDGRVTAGRAVTLAALFVTAGALASGAATGSDGMRPYLLAILAGALVLAVAGLIVLAVDSNKAIVPATTTQGARYTGIGSNPDTLSMLFALAVPLAVWALWDAAGRIQRIAAAVALLILDGSVAASGSRAMVGGVLVGMLVFIVAVPMRARLRVTLAAIAIAVFAINVGVGVAPPRAKHNPKGLYNKFGQQPIYGAHDAQATLPLQDEIGFPRAGRPVPHRELFDFGGRLPAWKGALHQGAERPALGYGFGTEERVFVDRYYPFLSDRPENSYIGTFLQLGVVGVLLLLALIVLAVRAGIRARGDPAVAACLAVVVAGAVIALGQSYITSVGSPATGAFWLCAFLLTVVPRSSASARTASVTSARK